MLSKIIAVLWFLEEQEINLPLFLDAFSWGHKECRDVLLIRQARAQLFHSKEMPRILKHWWTPPKSGPDTARPKGIKEIMEGYALPCLKEKINEEMQAVASFLRSKSLHLSTTELPKYILR